MKKVLLVAALAWVSVGVAVSAGWNPTQASAIATARRLMQPAAPAVAAQAAAQTVPAADAQATEYNAMVKQYCVGCHTQRSNTPAAHPLVLDNVDLSNVSRDAETWERVILKLAVGAMPPQGMPHPEPAKLSAFSGYLQTSLDKYYATLNNPGRYVAHRLNRTEYQNAIRDLLNVDFDAVDTLPSDGGEFGFDNIATALKTSPLLLERYLTAALRISVLAMGDKSVTPGAAVFPISLEHSQQEHVEGLPLGTRGGSVVRYNFPADAEYQLSGRLMWTVIEGYAGVEGHEKPVEFVVTVDGEQVYSAPVGGDLDHKTNSDDINSIRPIIDGRMTTRTFITAGPHDIGFTWVDQPGEEQAVWQPALRDSQEVHMASGMPRLRNVIIEGPYNVTGISSTPSRERLLVCKPASAAEEAPCAEKIFSTLTRRAYRRAVTPADVAAPLTFYTEARANGGDFDAGIRAGVARVISSPSFLFRVEHDPETAAVGTAHPVTDVELASRLSFFLWSSIPDDQLLTLATTGKLRNPGVLDAQVRRMIADPKADAFVDSFTGQWLQLRTLEAKVRPDLLMFPGFDDNIRQGFRTETQMLFANILREDRGLLEMLNADYTFVNERLARHYGIPGVYGERFRRVAITDPNRRGLLGQGSLLALTSVATRTSPTIRGKYILTTLMGLPEPVPPPNVPLLDDSAPVTSKMSTRERVESHRRNPVCASCHRGIDPLGFALENFDSAGQWREKEYSGNPVDSKTVLQDGTPVDSPVALRKWLTDRPDVFVGNVTKRLLIYALGRGLETNDMSVVRSLVKSAAQDNYRLTSIITGIVKSAPFQMRVRPAAEAGAQQANTRLE